MKLKVKLRAPIGPHCLYPLWANITHVMEKHLLSELWQLVLVPSCGAEKALGLFTADRV